jgi:2-amino-4-hydroxy-6-hydroxymethyldihydropteridine diphosphokinase
LSEGTRAYLGLGSNIGDRLANLTKAVELLKARTGLRISRISNIYETAPVGLLDQPWFLNAVVECYTSLTARELLETCLDVERRMGRVRRIKWGPRIIDIDLLLYGDENFSEEGLEVPHPRMIERLFVLIPLEELYPNWEANGRTIREMIDSLTRADGQSISRVYLGTPWVLL